MYHHQLLTRSNLEYHKSSAEYALEIARPDRKLVFTSYTLDAIPKETLKRWTEKGAEVTSASYDDIASLEKVLQGAEAVSFISTWLLGETRRRQRANVINTTTSCFVPRICYTSFIGAGLPEAELPYLPQDHHCTESLIYASGLTYNIQQNYLYADNIPQLFAPSWVFCDNKWILNSKGVPGAYVAREDCSRVAAALLLGKGEPNMVYNISGSEVVSEAVSDDKIFEYICAKPGLKAETVDMSDEELDKYWVEKGLPRKVFEDFLKLLMKLQILTRTWVYRVQKFNQINKSRYVRWWLDWRPKQLSRICTRAAFGCMDTSFLLSYGKENQPIMATDMGPLDVSFTLLQDPSKLVQTIRQSVHSVNIITSPIIIAAAAGFDTTTSEYLVSTSLIVNGILSAIQITRIHLFKTDYYLGTGLILVNGKCPKVADGSPLPCPEGYGAILGTASLCALLEMGLSFMRPSLLKKLFPPIVTGPTVTLIVVSLIQTALEGWAGGSGTCISQPTSGDYMLCPSNSASHALPWGSAEFLGLGFSVFLTIILCERFGSPIMKSTSVIFELLTGCIITAAYGYFDKSSIDAGPVVFFIWVKTFPWSIYGPLVLPLLAIYLILMMETIGDITASCDVSRLQVDGKLFDSRIQGGVLADGMNGMLACLFTITPMSIFAQNNGVITLTRCANRTAGYVACFFLIVMGVFSKFAAALVSTPDSVLGDMTTFLFSSVAISGIRIISTVPFSHLTRFILTAAMSLGFGATLVPTWFSYVFTYTGNNRAKAGFFDAIVLVMETGFAVTGFSAIILNLLISKEGDEDDTASIAADEEREVVISKIENEGVVKKSDSS
ncbi:hypothetical protein G7Y89_g2659 [Cudoniella acicularis]|uniref:Purine permease n=1 Tax=Cudoniella acicularis TaxID=354080 RepID=A0A8H4RU40_9HELO|nr:hypothetical protein G7Y89_g2659 [Cudoniella acicularis]